LCLQQFFYELTNVAKMLLDYGFHNKIQIVQKWNYKSLSNGIIIQSLKYFHHRKNREVNAFDDKA